MRDKRLSDVEEKMRTEIDNPDIPNNVDSGSIFAYKLYLSLIEQVVRLDAEIDLLKGGK
jgi:hypothetical protein